MAVADIYSARDARSGMPQSWQEDEVREETSDASAPESAIPLHDADKNMSLPVDLTVNNPLETKFLRLKCEWLRQLRSSKIRDAVLLKPYQQIIGMGPAALPFLFFELRTSPHHWFWALEAITCESPVTPEEAGNFTHMTAAWLAWANEHGF